MPHKTFKDESFTLKNLKLDVNSLSDSDPYVDHVKVIPESTNVEVIKYSANKKVRQTGDVTDNVTGMSFEAEEERTEDQRVSELPEKIKKMKAKLQNGHTVKINTDMGRYTDEDGNNASFYLTDEHLEDLEIVIDDPEEEAEDEGETEDEEEQESVL